MALGTVSEYVSAARVLLQDTVATYRYPDADLLLALNEGILEMRRLRPDLFLGASFVLPTFGAVDSTAVSVDEQYRMSLVYYMAGQAQLRDDEEGQDARAGAFIGKFNQALLGLAA